MAKITKRLVDTLTPGATESFVWDDSLPGFGVRVFPSGKRSYVVQYRNSGGRTRRLSIGPHGTLTPDQARKLAASKLAEVRAGKDPSAERHELRAATTLAELATRYVAEHLPKKKPKSAREDQRILQRYVLPALGNRPVVGITQSDVNRLHSALSPTPIMANRVLFLVSTVMNLAERWGASPLGSNPCRHVIRFRERKRERFLSDVELERLGRALVDLVEEGIINPVAAEAIRLLAITGGRRGEILGLRWDQIDVERGLLRLTESKGGRERLCSRRPLWRFFSGYLEPASSFSPRVENPGRRWERFGNHGLT